MKRKLLDLSKAEAERASNLHRKAIVIDASATTRISKYDELNYPSMLKNAGCTAMKPTIVGIPSDFARSMAEVSEWNMGLRKHSDILVQALTADDIRCAKENGRVAVVYGTQNAKCIEDNVAYLEIFHRLGFRSIQLTYQLKNYVGDGCGEKRDSGLSRFGETVVSEMNRLGILVDLAHVGPATTMDAIQFSRDAVIISHSGAYALAGTNRTMNCSDEGLKALAEKGGVVGQAAFSLCVKKNPAMTHPTIEDFLDHIDYITNLVGVDHVGLGLDVSEGGPLERVETVKRARASYPELVEGVTPETNTIEALDSVSKLANITRGLVIRGYSDQEILKILGGNFLRVFEQVW